MQILQRIPILKACKVVPAIDHYGSDFGNVLQFVRSFFTGDLDKMCTNF